MKFLAFQQILDQNDILTAQTLPVQKSIEFQGPLIQ